MALSNTKTNNVFQEEQHEMPNIGGEVKQNPPSFWSFTIVSLRISKGKAFREGKKVN